MPTLTPNAAVGARSLSIGMTSVDPARQMPDRARDEFLGGTGLNGSFVADLLSDVLTHERCGTHLYRSVEARTHNPVLKLRYHEFGQETLRHVEVLEELITALGGDPLYVSPAARATEKADSALVESTFLLAGSIDLMTMELVMLDAVMLAEVKDHANWTSLAALVEAFPEGDMRDLVAAAVAEVGPEETDHLVWAQEMRSRMIGMQASSSAMTSMTAKAEELVARIQGWFA